MSGRAGGDRSRVGHLRAGPRVRSPRTAARLSLVPRRPRQHRLGMDPNEERTMTDDRDFLSASMELAGLDRLDVPALELLYKLECSGEDFYNLLADRVGNNDVAALFRRNAKEELGHARRIAPVSPTHQAHQLASKPRRHDRRHLPLARGNYPPR